MQALKAFNDNYIWFFFDEISRHAWVVDPGDANPVMAMLLELKLELAGILLTHHHRDHSGGIDNLIEQYPKVNIIGSYQSKIKWITHPVKENDKIACLPYQFNVLEIPGHTLDHVAFYNDQAIFCGDTLFSAGCGRIFEGNPLQLYESLNKIMQLPETIKIYCGHEYTLANLRFAEVVEPNNAAIQNKIAKVKQLRKDDQVTLPALLAEEKAINPFLRCHHLNVKTAVENYAGQSFRTPLEVFACLREWKNNFI